MAVDSAINKSSINEMVPREANLIIGYCLGLCIKATCIS